MVQVFYQVFTYQLQEVSVQEYLLIPLLFRKPSYMKKWLLVSCLYSSRVHRSQTQIPRCNFHSYLCMLVFEDRIGEGEREETSNPDGH